MFINLKTLRSGGGGVGGEDKYRHMLFSFRLMEPSFVPAQLFNAQQSNNIKIKFRGVHQINITAIK